MQANLRILSVTLVAFSCLVAGAPAQEESVAPGINNEYIDPNPEQWVERFEREGREVYDQREAIVAACNIQPGMDIADVGAGTGLFVPLLARQTGPSGRVYAVDISEEFIRLILSRAKMEGLKHVEGIVCDPDDTKLPENSVDLVFVCDTYHHFEYPQKSLASIHRALRPGGRLVIVDFERIPGTSSAWILNHVRAGKEVFRAEIEAAGFKLIDEPKLLKENYILRFTKVDESRKVAK